MLLKRRIRVLTLTLYICTCMSSSSWGPVPCWSLAIATQSPPGQLKSKGTGPRSKMWMCTVHNWEHHCAQLCSQLWAHCMSWCGSQIWRWHWIGMLVAWGYHGSPLVVFNQTLHNVGCGAWPIVRIGGVQLKNLRVRCLCLSWHLRSCNTLCSREGSEQCVVSLLWSV